MAMIFHGKKHSHTLSQNKVMQTIPIVCILFFRKDTNMDNSTLTAKELFPLFYNCDFIKSIANISKWTISDKDKMPIDMVTLRDEHRIFGAKTPDDTCLVTLDEVCNIVPCAGNHAFWLDSLVDNWVVLDIEPKCPRDILQNLLSLPYIYGELSLSGNGVHLIFPLPKTIYNYPNALKKIVFKEEHGWYELLLNHYVTFTRKMITPYQGDTNDQTAFVEFFNKMASEQKEVIKDDIDITEFEELEIPYVDEIIQILSNQKYDKRPADFFNDNSRFEFGYTSFLLHKLNKLVKVSKYQTAFDEQNYDKDDLVNVKAFILYKTLTANLQPRAKHEESRDGLPWLLYITRETIAKTPDMSDDTE